MVYVGIDCVGFVRGGGGLAMGGEVADGDDGGVAFAADDGCRDSVCGYGDCADPVSQDIAVYGRDRGAAGKDGNEWWRGYAGGAWQRQQRRIYRHHSAGSVRAA